MDTRSPVVSGKCVFLARMSISRRAIASHLRLPCSIPAGASGVSRWGLDGYGSEQAGFAEAVVAPPSRVGPGAAEDHVVEQPDLHDAGRFA